VKPSEITQKYLPPPEQQNAALFSSLRRTKKSLRGLTSTALRCSASTIFVQKFSLVLILLALCQLRQLSGFLDITVELFSHVS
jgi:hypothetical protein